MTTSNIPNNESTFDLTEEQCQLLEEERALHLSGESKSYTREEARELIKVTSSSHQ